MPEAIESFGGALVVGGGLAGAAAATWLARAGKPVRLWERERYAAHKICGEFLSWEAQAWLADLGLDLDALGAVPITRLRLVTAASVVEVPLGFTAKSLTRHRLDAALLAIAEEAGADVRRGVSARGLAPDGSVSGSHGTVAPAALFVATGKHNLRGLPRDGGGTLDHLLGFKAYFRLAPAERAALSNHIELILFRGGYAGFQMVERESANLCLLVPAERFRAAEGDFGRLVDELCMEIPLLRQRLQGAVTLLDKPLAISGVPYGFLHRHDAAGVPNLWRLGDQAAVIPSFTGDGMSLALHSARLATRAYLLGQEPQAYLRQLHKDVGRPVRIATFLQRHSNGEESSYRRLIALARIAPGLLPLVARLTRLAPGAMRRAG